MANNIAVDPEQKVSVSEICAVGLNYSGGMVQTIMVGSYISFFYTNYCGLPAGMVGAFVAIATVIDFFTDFIMGAIVDSKNYPEGKVTPWLRKTLIPMVLMILCPFFVPFEGTGFGVVMWAGLMYVLAQAVFCTMRTIPLMMLPAVITKDMGERTKVESIGMMAIGMVIMIASSYAIFPLVNLFGGGKWGWFGAACVFAAVCLIMAVSTMGRIHERVMTEAQPRQGIVEIWKGLINCCKSKNYLIVMIVFTLGQLGTATAVTAYYATYILKNPSATAHLMMLLMVPTVFGYVLCPFLVKKMGKKNACLATYTLGIISFIIMIAFETNTTLFYIAMALNSLGITGFMGCKLSMTADSLELYRLQTGEPLSEAVAYSAQTMVSKLGTALKSAIVGAVLAATGYISSVGGEMVEQSNTALFGIRALFLYIPLGIMILSMVLIFFYDTDKKLPEVRAALAEQEAN